MSWRPGRASSARIAPASAPPIRKNANAVTQYRIPIRLWSVVVSQRHRSRPAYAGERAHPVVPPPAAPAVAQRLELRGGHGASPGTSCTRAGSPQNSAHTPRNVPSSTGVRSNSFTRPGIASVLNRNDGTQNAWITSVDVSTTRVGLPEREHDLGAGFRARGRRAHDHDALVGVREAPPPGNAVASSVDVGVGRRARRTSVVGVERDQEQADDDQHRHGRVRRSRAGCSRGTGRPRRRGPRAGAGTGPATTRCRP